eukprot:m.346874 g.346874  ORF g.346874 m.346874 type:complete len:386 (-) comp30551_c0_seq1:12-1169(-)
MNIKAVVLLSFLLVAVECGKILVFSPPNIVADVNQGGGPWWDKIHGLNYTHSFGWAETHLIASNDSGKTWGLLNFSGDNCSTCSDDTAVFGGVFDHVGTFHNLGSLNITNISKSNLTTMASLSSTRFFLKDSATFTGTGAFMRSATGPVSITGLPHLRYIRPGAGASLKLPDGSMVASVIVTLAEGRPLLSTIALRSLDNGFTWRYASIIAACAEVPYAVEGPSESALALLANGTIICVMRVEGQSGHYAPYISKLSDDGGQSWHSLRSLSNGAGCVRPRLLPLNGSLVLSGGRPNPISRDVLLWLNGNGDGNDWEPYSVSYWHNKLVSNDSWKFPPAATNDSRSFPRLTTSYTSLVATGMNSGYVLYGMGVRSFTLPFTIADSS